MGAQARSHFEESLTTTHKLGNLQGVADGLYAFAMIGVREAQERRAVVLCAAAAALRETIGYALPPNDREKQEREIASVRAALGEAAFSTAWEEGRALTMEQAIERALTPD